MKQIVILFFLLTFFLASIIVFVNIRSKGQYSPKIRSIPTPMSTQPPTNIQKQLFLVKGSIPYWDQDNAFSSFEENVNKFNYLNLFWYYLGDTGIVEKYETAEEDKSIIDFAHANKVKALAVVTNLSDKRGSTWDSKLVENVIESKTTRDKHVSDIIEEIEELDFDGVTIDYEEVKKSQKEKFSSFVKELSDSLHKNGKIVAVAIHPKTDLGNGNGAFQNWEELAKHADHLNIMAYGEHWDESSAGPIASIGWVEKIIRYSKNLNIPPEKFILGIPLYGYDWNKDDEASAEGLTYKDAQNLLTEFDAEEQWDYESSSPYFLYNNDGDSHEVWFENARSVVAKIDLAKKAGFGGVTFWRLGGEDPKIWEELERGKR